MIIHCHTLHGMLSLTEIEIMCGHWSISIHLSGMTEHKCTWSVGMANQHA